jgi:hypothetical protein
VGRFISADVIVPDPTNPQQFNRYSYVLNNALRYTDPSGRYCYDPSSGLDLVGTCIDEANWSTYSLLPRTLPKRPDDIKDSTWNTYVTVWNQLQGTSHILEDGRIQDTTLVAMLIRIELNGIDGDLYKAALEGVSNQYQGYGCGGACRSLGQQLRWMNNMQGWYGRNGNSIPLDDCKRCFSDAMKAIEGFNNPDGYSSWWWGNPKPNSAMAQYLQLDPSGRTRPSWGDDSLGGGFIIAGPIPGGGNYSHFLVVTYEQNIACGNYPGPLTCMGFQKP